jgi:hypothetical protein
LKGVIGITLYESKIWIIKDGLLIRNDRLKVPIEIKNTQTIKQFMSSMPKRRGEVQGFVFSLLVVDEGLQLSLTMTSFVLLASEPYDRASK